MSRMVKVAIPGLAALLLLGGCAGRHGERGHMMAQHGRDGPPTGLQILQLQDRNKNGILDQLEVVQSVKTCKAEPCEVLVTVAATVSPTTPVGFDCGVAVSADILIFNNQVSRLSWKLQQPAGTENEYRFRPQIVGSGSPYGIYLYADPKNAAFSVTDTPTEVVLTRKMRKEEGFAYGVYIDWRSKKEGGNWQACNPLDPIIIEHN